MKFVSKLQVVNELQQEYFLQNVCKRWKLENDFYQEPDAKGHHEGGRRK